MRLWSLHPQYLDPQGLVALWRETLLAQAVLRGETRGYRNHPQLDRFKHHPRPLTAMSRYLMAIHADAKSRGYSFDESKFRSVETPIVIPVSKGQLEYEWQHLMAKLRLRSPELFRTWQGIQTPEPHPILKVRRGAIEDWERAASLSLR